MLTPPSNSQLLYSVRPPLMLYWTFPLIPTVPSSWFVWFTTPGDRVTNCVKLRPLSSSWLICLPDIVVPIAADVVSTCATLSPVTTTSSDTEPTVKGTSMRTFAPTLTTTPFAVYFWKPVAVTDRLYVPPGKPATT